jgi:hypothetical protein
MRPKIEEEFTNCKIMGSNQCGPGSVSASSQAQQEPSGTNSFVRRPVVTPEAHPRLVSTGIVPEAHFHLVLIEMVLEAHSQVVLTGLAPP